MIGTSPHHGAVDDVLNLLAIILPELTGRRGSDHHDEALLRIAEKLRAVGAVPGELAGVAGDRRQAFAGAYRHCEAKATAAAMRLHVRHVVLDFGSKVVGGHVMHGLGAKDALAVELAAVEEHLAKADVVADGRKRAGAAAVWFGWRVEQLDRLRLARERVIGKRTC